MEIQTKFLEGALGHSWEYPCHGINPVFRILLHHACNLIYRKDDATTLNTSTNLDAIGAELPSKEYIHEVDVAKDIEEVDGLCDEHLEGPDVVATQVFYKVASKHLSIDNAKKPFTCLNVLHKALVGPKIIMGQCPEKYISSSDVYGKMARINRQRKRC